MSYPPLIQASTSPFRRALLERLKIPFTTAMPNVDETMQPEETPRDMVLRLATAKARSVAPAHPHALVIGSDQVACIDGRVLGKLGERVRAIERLARSSGREVVFYTGLCLLNTSTRRAQRYCEPCRVHFRKLSREQIEGYVDREKPFPRGCRPATDFARQRYRLRGHEPNRGAADGGYGHRPIGVHAGQTSPLFALEAVRTRETS
jgi:septum formation protein